MVTKLLHTRMRVNDLERTVKFYEHALGLKVSRRHTSPRGAQLAFLATPNSDEEIEICQLPNSPAVQVQPDLMHLAAEVFARQPVAEFVDALEDDRCHPHQRNVVPVEKICQRLVEMVGVVDEHRGTERYDHP